MFYYLFISVLLLETQLYNKREAGIPLTDLTSRYLVVSVRRRNLYFHRRMSRSLMCSVIWDERWLFNFFFHFGKIVDHLGLSFLFLNEVIGAYFIMCICSIFVEDVVQHEDCQSACIVPSDMCFVCYFHFAIL